MAHYDKLLDIGYDYGADGGRYWNTSVVPYGGTREFRTELDDVPLGRWQLGNRMVDAAFKDYLQAFVNTMRGRSNTFLFRDWGDSIATDEVLTVSGATTQLTKTYSVDGINDHVRDIIKPDAAITIQVDGSDYTDFTLDTATGIVTWTGSPPAGTVTWSGVFYVPVRFDVEAIPVQFVTYEQRAGGDQAFYSLGSINVVERPASEVLA